MRALALVPFLALAACDVDPGVARAVLRDRGFERIDLIAEPALGRACDWSEPYARRFLARDRDGRLVTGLICATGEDAQDARLLRVDAVATRAPAWDSFGGRR